MNPRKWWRGARSMERRSPTGIARERETSADDGAPYRLEWRAPCSIRTALFAALRAGARNPHQQRCAPPFTAANGASPTVESRKGGTPPRCGLRPASRGSAKPAPMTVRRTDVSGAPPAQSGLRCSPRARGADRRSAFPCRRVACAQSDCAVRPPAAGCADRRSAFPCRRVIRPASRGSAKPAPTTLRPANLTAANGASPIAR